MRCPSTTEHLVHDTDYLVQFIQFAEAYNNLQNITRRHIHVHEPLIYDSVLVAAKALNYSQAILEHHNLTLNSTTKSGSVERKVQDVLEQRSFSGLTVSCAFGAHHTPASMHMHMHIHIPHAHMHVLYTPTHVIYIHACAPLPPCPTCMYKHLKRLYFTLINIYRITSFCYV